MESCREELRSGFVRVVGRLTWRWLFASALIFVLFLLADVAVDSFSLWPLQMVGSAVIGLFLLCEELRHSSGVSSSAQILPAKPEPADRSSSRQDEGAKLEPAPLDEAKFAHIKAYLLQQLSARTLLLNMAVGRARSPGYAYYPIGLDGRMLGDGGDLSDYDAIAAQIVDALNADPQVSARLETLLRMGFEMRFGIYDEPWRRDLQLTLVQNPKADRKLRAEARKQAGAVTPAAARRYDAQWQLYFNQHYAEDWEEWRKRAPLATLP